MNVYLGARRSLACGRTTVYAITEKFSGSCVPIADGFVDLRLNQLLQHGLAILTRTKQTFERRSAENALGPAAWVARLAGLELVLAQMRRWVFREAVISIMATLAKQERVRRSERTKARLAIARARGKRLGRPQLRTSVAEVAHLKAQGLSLRAIARRLRIGDGSVRRLLAPPA